VLLGRGHYDRCRVADVIHAYDRNTFAGVHRVVKH
jgi:hypothetical protein